MRYFVLEKDSGNRMQIEGSKLDQFFNVLQAVTGLDRATAEPILHSGKPIDHPRYQFTAEKINPFQPARLVF